MAGCGVGVSAAKEAAGPGQGGGAHGHGGGEMEEGEGGDRRGCSRGAPTRPYHGGALGERRKYEEKIRVLKEPKTPQYCINKSKNKKEWHDQRTR